MADEKCTTVGLDVESLSRSVEAPRLSSLLSSGWEVVAALTVVDGKGEPELRLVLRPPRKWLRQVIVGGIVAGVVGGAVFWLLSELPQLTIGL